MTIKIFKNKDGKLTEIEKVVKDQPWDHEKEIQTLVQNNVQVIFPELEFVDDEFSVETNVDRLRPDSICFNKEARCFVIIEYKKLKHGGAIDQAMAYLDLLDTNKDKFISLYHEKKQVLLDPNDINWEETKVKIISPQYTPHQLRAAKRTTEPIEFWLIGKYEGHTTFQMLHEQKKQEYKKTERQYISTTGEYSEEDYLAGKYYPSHKSAIPTEEGIRLFKIIKNKILERYPDLEVKQRSKYVGFYSTIDGSSVCSITVAKDWLDLGYATSEKNVFQKSEFVRYMVYENGKTIGFWGLGNYKSRINNESDIEKSILLIQKVYDIKVK